MSNDSPGPGLASVVGLIALGLAGAVIGVAAYRAGTGAAPPPPPPAVGSEVAAEAVVAPEVEDPDWVAPVGDRLAGTDSAAAPRSSTLDTAVRQRLISFGSHYLSYDYRQADAERLDRLAPLATAALVAELSRPLPAPLGQQLVDAQQVVVATFVELRAIDDDVYALTYDVETTSGSGSAEVERRIIVVTVGADRLVSEVL